MTKNVTSLELQEQTDTLLNEVGKGNVSVVVEQNGEAKAVLIPIEQYQVWLQSREAAFQRIEEIGDRARARWEAAGISEDEMEQLIQETVEEVRAEAYEAQS